jgi:hypothetical protein
MTSQQFKARPTVYEGIAMRSRLEARYAAWLDEVGFEWAYEPCAFANRDRQYLPDFRIRDVAIRQPGLDELGLPDLCCDVYVELKPSECDVNEQLLRLGTIWDSEPGAAVLLEREHRPPMLGLCGKDTTDVWFTYAAWYGWPPGPVTLLTTLHPAWWWDLE